MTDVPEGDAGALVWGLFAEIRDLSYKDFHTLEDLIWEQALAIAYELSKRDNPDSAERIWSRSKTRAAMVDKAAPAGVSTLMIDALRDVPVKLRFCTPSIDPRQRMLRWPLLSEISISDNMMGALADGTGLVAKVEKLVASVHDAKCAFLFIDGSSGAIRAMVEWISSWSADALVGVSRTAHKAVIHHLDAYGVSWYYIETEAGPTTVPEAFAKFDAIPPTSRATVEAALKKRTKTTHLMITAVTYEGVVAPMAEIRNALDEMEEDRPILIADEAWGAHFAFEASGMKKLRAIHTGADLANVSTHKTGGAAQGTAAILISKKCEIPETSLKQLLAVIRGSVTTSPNFPLLASIEAATSSLNNDDSTLHPLLGETIARAKALGEGLEAIDGIEVFDHSDRMKRDPLKVTAWLDPKCWTGFSLAKDLETNQIIVEQSGYTTVQFLVTLSTSEADIGHLIDLVGIHTTKHHALRPLLEVAVDPLRPEKLSPADRTNAGVIKFELGDTPDDTSYIAADTVSPYPPGIPAIVPGATVTRETITNILATMNAGGHVVSGAGCHDKLQFFGWAKEKG